MEELNTELQASLAATITKYNSHRRMLKHAYKELVAHEDGKGEIHMYPPRSQQLIERIAQVLMHQPLSSSFINDKDSINDGLMSNSSRSSQSAFMSSDVPFSSSVLPATTSTKYGLPSTKEPELHSHKHRSKDTSKRNKNDKKISNSNNTNNQDIVQENKNLSTEKQHEQRTTTENEKKEMERHNKSNRSNNNTYDRGNEFRGENDNAFGGDVGCAFPPSLAAVSCENNTKVSKSKELSFKKPQKEIINKSNRSNNNTYDRGNEFSGENDNAFGGDVGCAFPPSVAAVSCENNIKINETDSNDTNRYIIDSNDVESYNQELSQYTSREALTNNTLSNHYSSASTHPTQREMTINKEARPEIDHTEWHTDDFHANVNVEDDDDDDNNDGLISSTDLTTLTQNRYKNKIEDKKISNNNVVSLLSSQPTIPDPPENKNTSSTNKEKAYISTNTQSSHINDNSDNFVSALSATTNISNNNKISNTVAARVASSDNIMSSSKQQKTRDDGKYQSQDVKQDHNSSPHSTQQYTQTVKQEQEEPQSSSRKTSFSSMTNSRYAPLNLSNTYHDSNIDGNNVSNNTNETLHANNDGNTTRSSVRRQSFEKPHKTLRGASHREHLEGLAYDFRSTSSLASNDSKYYYYNNTCAKDHDENVNTSNNNNIRRGSSYEHGPNRKTSMSSLTSELSSTRFDNNNNNCNNNNYYYDVSKNGNEAHNNEDDEINSQLKSSVAQAAIRVRESLEAKLSQEKEENNPNVDNSNNDDETKCSTNEHYKNNMNAAAKTEKHDAAVNVSESTSHATSRKKRPVGIPITPWPIPENNNNTKNKECNDPHHVEHESLAEQLQRQGIVPSSAISRTHSHSCSNSRHEPQVYCGCEKSNDSNTNNKDSDKLYKANEGALITEPQPQDQQIIAKPVVSNVLSGIKKNDTITQTCVVSQQQQQQPTTETLNMLCTQEEEKLRNESEIRKAAARYREKELQDMARASSAKAQLCKSPEEQHQQEECKETNALTSDDLHEQQKRAEDEFDRHHKRNVEQNTTPALRTAVSRRNGGHFLDSSQIEKAMYGAKVSRTPWSREVVSDVAAVKEYMEREDAKLAHRKAKEKLDNAIALTAAEEAAIVRARSPSRALVPLSGLNLSPTSQYGNNVSVGMIMSSNGAGGNNKTNTSYSRERNYEGALVIRDEEGKLVAVDDSNKELQCNALRNFPNEVKVIPTTTERQLLAERAILEQQLDRMVREVELISSKNNENGHEPRYAQLNARITRVQADLTKVNKELSTVIHLERKARQGL